MPTEAIQAAAKARGDYYSEALKIQVRLETESLTKAERQKLERTRKIYRKFWRHYAKVERQLKERYEKHGV